MWVWMICIFGELNIWLVVLLFRNRECNVIVSVVNEIYIV